MAHLDFSQEEVERARRYHRPLYRLAALGTALSAAVNAVIAWSPAGDELWSGLAGLGWAAGAAGWAAVVVCAGFLVHLPLGFWRSLVYERRWGFSRETPRSWAADQAKALAISLVLGAGAWATAVALGRALPRFWWAPAAGGAALLVVALAFVAPVALEPLFNRFQPLADERLATELRRLAAAAGVPVRDVLVADASRRTTKSNAYVSGLGATRRVVLWDTLLASADEPELKLVVAHELGHRRERHPAKLTALFGAGSVVAVLLMRAVVGPPEARDLPVVLLLFAGLELAGLPFLAALSRRFERSADRWSLELTRDLPAFERAHRALARDNLSDLAPPRLAYLFLFTHPTPPERLAAGRENAAGLHRQLVA